MQALKPSYLSGSVHLSETLNGRPRTRGPVWVMRYRLPSGRDSARVIGPAWRKRGRPPTGFYTRVTAEAAMRAFLAEHANDKPGVMMPSFNALAQAWLAEKERSIRPSTIRSYRSIIARDLLPRWGRRSADAITKREVQAYRDEIAARGVAPNTLNQYRAVIRGIFGLAVRRHDLYPNPALAFEWAKDRRAKSGAISFYRPDEIERLARAAVGQQDAAIYLTAAFTGLRASELRALRWRFVDFYDALVHVQRGYTEEGGEDLPKSYRARSVPLMPQVGQVLLALRQREHFTADDDLVFVSPTGGPVDRSALYRRYVEAAERAGLRRLRFHDLRHSFGTMAVRAFPITDVQEWMGHATIETTRVYVHYAPRKDAAAKLGALVSGGQLVPLAAARTAA